MAQLDSLYNEHIESLLRTTDDISHHTNAWDSWYSVTITIVSLIAAIITILGLCMIIHAIQSRKYTKKRQSALIKDLIRHLFENAAIIEAIKIKTKGQWDKKHPEEGTFKRFCVLENDLSLGDINVKDEQFIKLHSLCLYMRNYNIAVEIAEKNFNCQSVSNEEKSDEIIDLWHRTKKTVNELVQLGFAANLLKGRKPNNDGESQENLPNELAEFIKEHIDLENQKIDPRIKKRAGDATLFDDDYWGLKNHFDKLISKKIKEIRVVPF
jgi:hypothetical protein